MTEGPKSLGGFIIARDRGIPLIPPDSRASHALVVVIAIMTLLACLSAGAALLIERASVSWRTDIGKEVTIQLKPEAGEDVDALVARIAEAAREAPGVAEARAVSSAETARMLEPWLGSGIDISRLPVPRLVIVRMRESRGADLGPLRATVAAVAPLASIDDHALWLSRLGIVAGVTVSLAIAIFLLVLTAMATAVGFATRGAVAENKPVIEVLHFVGATDRFIAEQFQAHFMQLGFRGAGIGGGAAASLFLLATLLSAWWAHSQNGAETAALFGDFSLRAIDYLVIAAISVGIATLTGYISRWIVRRRLAALM